MINRTPIYNLPMPEENDNYSLSIVNEVTQKTEAGMLDVARHLIPCTAAYDTVTKRHTLTPTQTGITLPDIFTARFLATTAFTAGDKVYIGGAEYIPSYTDGDTAVETGAWIANAVVSLDCKKAGLKAYVGAGFGKQFSQYAVEFGTVTLTNNKSYPFNNSDKSISFVTVRDNLNYTVTTEIVSAAGAVEAVETYDKQLNGFKLKFHGSATSAVIKYYIMGGLVR